MKKPQVYAVIKKKDGTLSKVPIKLDRDNWKLGRNMIQDHDSKLWLYKKKYEYLDKKNIEESQK